MIVKLPGDTKDLWKRLEEEVNKLDEHERNTFVLDLIKFCVDWQFNLLAFKNAEKFPYKEGQQ